MTLLELKNGKWCVIAVIAASCQSAPLANNDVPNGAGGAAGTPGTGGSASGTGGMDATGRMGDAGALPPPAVALVSAHDYDVYCGLKAGQLKCWAAALYGSLFSLDSTSRAVGSAPPDLQQVAITDSPAFPDPALCGIDLQGRGSCWAGRAGALGEHLQAVTVSSSGTCVLDVGGAVSCTGIDTTGMPADGHYTQIAASENLLAALDENGKVFFPHKTFPSGVYTEIVTNDVLEVGAVRADGAVVYFPLSSPTVPVIKEGTFVHLALDLGSDACALDRAGEITCWPDQGFAGPLAASDLPRGPFNAIVGASGSFCAVRTTGTIVCWGSDTIEVPPGW